jgi:hypothetical protein
MHPILVGRERRRVQPEVEEIASELFIAHEARMSDDHSFDQDAPGRISSITFLKLVGDGSIATLRDIHQHPEQSFCPAKGPMGFYTTSEARPSNVSKYQNRYIFGLAIAAVRLVTSSYTSWSALEERGLWKTWSLRALWATFNHPEVPAGRC